MRWKFMENYFGIYKKILEKITTRGGPPGEHKTPGRARYPRRALVGCAQPSPPPVPIFWYISHFDLEKNRGLSGRSAAVSRRNLGRSTFPLRRSDSDGGNFLPEREINVIIITNNSPILGGGGDLHQHLQQHHLLSNPSSSLVFNLCTGTSDWYLWVTSSVDYIL